MAKDKNGIPFHPAEYNPDYPRIKCKQCGLMNSCTHLPMDAEPWYPRLPVLLEGGMVESIDDFVLHHYTEYSLKKIRDTKIHNHRLTIDKFIHPELLQKLISNWPADMYTIDVKGRLQADITCNEYYQQLFDLIFNNEYVRCAIADKFEFEHEYETSMWLWQDTQQFRVNDVHIDHDNFDITFGLYLPKDDSLKKYGTQFWKPKEFEKDLTKSLLRDNCSLIDQLPFTAGTCYFMPRSINSWHSSPILDTQMERNHAYGYYKSI
jgi:hypothetical protein